MEVSQLIEVEKQQSREVAVSQPMRLLEMAVSSNADIEKLERLMALQTQWEAKESHKAYLDAMTRFQRNCPDILKMKRGHNYLYAPLADIVAQIRDVLSSAGLSYRFEQKHENGIEVTCIVSHVAGHSERTTMKAAPDTSGSKNAIQAVGSAVQYLMRYTLIGALGITTADHDMDGRLPQKPACELITPESEAFLTDHYNSLDHEKQKAMLTWLRIDNIGALCSFSEESAQRAIKALKTKANK